jgi:hypothetical protein
MFASTRRKLSARGLAMSKLVPEIQTSAFGATATFAPLTASRSTMSRRRSAVRPDASRSSCVPPTWIRYLLPKFFSIAEVSHGVAMSSMIGPLDSRHTTAPQATITTASKLRPMTVARRMIG